MSSGRKRDRKNITWTVAMLNDLQSCKEEALLRKASDNAPRKASGRKVGYMEIMHDIWGEKGYRDFNLSPQNLVDILNRNKRKATHIASQVEVTIATEVATPESEQIVNNVRNVEDVSAPSITFDDVLIKKLIDEAVRIYESGINNCGNMSNRLIKTKFKSTPTNKSVEYVNEVCRLLMVRYNVEQCTDYVKSLWKLNTIVYSSIASWVSVNNIRGMTLNNLKNAHHLESKAIRNIDEEIKHTRAFISKCVAEKERLCSKGRVTRRTRRNRKEILKFCDGISVYSLTCLIACKKKRLTYLAKRRKRTLKLEAVKRINTQFSVNQSNVFCKFTDAIERDPENMTPVYNEKTCGGERKYFENVNDVELFWRKLWEADDKGNPQAGWLNEFRDLFAKIVPDLEEKVQFTEKDCFDCVRKKKNWSAPGPDRIVNYWWKNLRSVKKTIYTIFFHIINHEILVERWFCRGRTGLIPKDGEWSIPNQRPITCLNNMYKWLTAVIKMIGDRHLKRYRLMQTDQRGACSGVSGTVDNLLIDDMVQRDAILHKRNLVTTWIDVRKAFDSVSHSFLIEILRIHRFPTCIVTAVRNIISLWNIVLVVPLKDGPVESSVIYLKNGELQGDTFCPNLYTLCNNLVSWVIRSFKGYDLSSPIKEKVTHSLFIDDLKLYSSSIKAALQALNMIKPRMKDCGLEWNEKKCKACCLKSGKFQEYEDLVLYDGKKIEFLKEGESYKFMGIHQSIKLEKDALESSLLVTVKQRTHVIWSSDLHDWNKVLATNMYVNGSIEYYFWGCNLRIDFLKEVDRSIRKVMNVCGAKHTNTVNEGLYLSRQKGGRGLKSVETSYKETKIKAAMKLKQNDDPRMKLVNRFFQIHLQTSSYSIFKEAEKFCREKGCQLECYPESITVRFPGEDEELSTEDKQCIDKFSRKMKVYTMNQCLQAVMSSKWQGVILKSIMEDESLLKGNFYWLGNWRWCPTSTISEMMLLLYQTLDTKCYRQHFVAEGASDEVPDTLCRLCKNGQESVKHLLSNCGELAKKVYKDRHDSALKCFFFHLLVKFGFMEEVPAWNSPIKIKPLYEKEDVSITWDVPEYSGRDGETIKDAARPDGKIVLHQEKKIFLVEQTIPWIENRNAKFDFKETKYVEVKTFLKMGNPEYEVDQITLVMDSFGGYSEHLRLNIEKIFLNRTDAMKIIRDMQKSVISSEAHLTRVFKMRTKFGGL